jgi:Raf kinase inhibitor-like YbhB/YbcL family protein
MPRRTSSLVAAAVLAATLTAARPSQAQFTLSATGITAGGRIPDVNVFNAMNCTGKNMSPALSWKGAPAGTMSFALTVYDPDAPTGSGWWHWVIYNIPASAKSLAADAGNPKGTVAPAGSVQGNTDFGAPGYGGPCPPVGDKPHHYIFTLYALKVAKLDVPATATAAYVGFNLHANQLGTATLTAVYGR